MSMEFYSYFALVQSLKAKEYYFKIFDIKSAQSLLIAMPHINIKRSEVYFLLVILVIISDTLLSVKINNSPPVSRGSMRVMTLLLPTSS